MNDESVIPFSSRFILQIHDISNGSDIYRDVFLALNPLILHATILRTACFLINAYEFSADLKVRLFRENA